MVYKATVRSGGALPWFFQRVSGLYLAVVLFLHVIMTHVLVRGELDFSDVAERVATPLWKTLDISFLVIALFHGLYGAWIVLDDYIHVQWLRTLIYGAIAVAAVMFVSLGVLTLIAFNPGG
jgi:succinate dehydrogenase / fumarate reductase membrane anchor subunit